MSAWPHQSIASLGTVITGSTPRTSEEHFYGGDIPFVTPAELAQINPIMNAARTLSESGSQETRLLPEGTVMVCCIGSLGKVGIAGRTVASNQQINSVIFDPKLIWPRFGLYACRLLKSRLETLAPATTVAIVNKSKFEQLEIPVPPLPEQRRIADILDRAEALRAKRRAALAQLDELVQSIFTKMFGDPVENPKNWKTEKIQNVVSQIEAGWSANGEHRPREENEYAVLKVSAVTQGVFLPEECKVISNDIEFKKVVTPEIGDVLFSRANTLELVGASCLIGEDYPYLLLPDKLWKIKVNEDKILPEYFKFVLSYPTMRYEISKRSTGTSGSMYNISMDKFRIIKITVPPIEIQKKFSIIVSTIEKIRTSQNQSLLEINNLFDSLTHEAFTGKLFSPQSFERQIEREVKI